LWLRGPQRFAGYFRDAMRTAEAITPDGWYRSGDLLVRDADGAYAVRGRRKEMFISGGENIFPAEVETAVAANEAIAEVCVVAMPDGRWGEVGCAFVVPRAGRTVDGEGLRRELRTRLAGYKVPKVIQVLDALPRLGSGKVDRAALARRATAMAGPPAPP
jgi:fatty-acyl-CoA synthase